MAETPGYETETEILAVIRIVVMSSIGDGHVAIKHTRHDISKANPCGLAEQKNEYQQPAEDKLESASAFAACMSTMLPRKTLNGD